MKNNGKIMFLVASIIWTLIGHVFFEPVEQTMMSFLSFVAALLLIYAYFGTKKIVCDFAEITTVSKNVILENTTNENIKMVNFQVQLLTFGVAVLLFAIGFGFGRALYHLVH